MRLAPEVEKRKQAHEAEVLRRNASSLRSRGALLLEMGPFIDVLVVPPPPARLQLPVMTPPPQLGVRFVPVDASSLAPRAFVLRFHLDGYDQRAPSVAFLDPRTLAPLSFGDLPIIHEHGSDGSLLNLVVDGHPNASDRPFLCVQGVREYHEHPQHSGDEWPLYRGSVNVYAILDRVLRAIGQTRPSFTLGIAGWQLTRA